MAIGNVSARLSICLTKRSISSRIVCGLEPLSPLVASVVFSDKVQPLLESGLALNGKAKRRAVQTDGPAYRLSAYQNRYV
jgi:hypothetical protein